MPDLPTRSDLFNVGADEITARSQARPPEQRWSRELIFTEGSGLNINTASPAAMGEEVVRHLALRLKAQTLDGAEGEDLDRWVADRYSPTIVRKEATPAVVELEMSRTTGALPAGTVSAGTRIRTENGTEFKTELDASLAAGSTGPVTVLAQASEAGLAGNVAAHTLTEFVDVPSDPALVVTNPEPATGGDAQETDARLRERARQFYPNARRGVLGAIEEGALTVPGIRQAVAIEEVDAAGIPTGRVALYVADANGQANSALVGQVRTALLEWRCGGVYVDVAGATPVYVSILLRLRFASGVSTTLAATQVRRVVVAGVNQLLPSATLEVSLITAAARAVPGVIVLEDAVVTPVGDVVPNAGEVLRTSFDRVTVE